MQTDEELKQLLALAEREHPGLLDRDPNAYPARNFAGEFKSAFYAIGLITRLAEPTKKIAFSTYADRLNGLLRRRGHTEVEGDVVMAAVIAWVTSTIGYRICATARSRRSLAGSPAQYRSAAFARLERGPRRQAAAQGVAAPDGGRPHNRAGPHGRRMMVSSRALDFLALGPMRIPTKPAGCSDRKPATDSDLKPAGVPI
jgi:hypothetical protein